MLGATFVIIGLFVHALLVPHLTSHWESHVNVVANSADIRTQMLLAKDKCGLIPNFQFDNDNCDCEIYENSSIKRHELWVT